MRLLSFMLPWYLWMHGIIILSSMSLIMEFPASHGKFAFQTLTQQALNVLSTLIQRSQHTNNILWTLKKYCVPAGNIFMIYSYFHTARIMIFRCEFLCRHAKNLQYVINFFLFLSFSCLYKGSSYNTMCSCYSVSLQEQTYILFHNLSWLNNWPIYKLKKGKPITLAVKHNSAVQLPVNWIPTCAEAVDQHQQLGGRLKHFSSFRNDPLLQSREKQAQKESKYHDRFISEEKIFTDMIRNDSVLRDGILYFTNLSREL